VRKVSVIALLLILAAGYALADPALGGGRGLWRVQDARVEEDGALVFANRWMFNREAFGDVSVWRGPLYGLEMNYAPVPVVEVFGSLIGITDFKTGPNRLYYDWQGESFGAKLSVPFLPVFKLAGTWHWLMERSDYHFVEDGFMDGLATKGMSWRAVGAFRFAELYKTLPTLMFNYGQSFEENGNKFLGAGIEFPSNAVDLFVEITSEVPSDENFSAFFGKDYTPKARVAPGVRIKIPYFHLNGGVEIALNDSVPDYEAILGFSFVSPFPKMKPKPWGRLAGKVQDARSDLPLEAKITFPNRKIRPLQTDPATGVFFLQKAPVGVVVVQASKEGYIPDAVPMVITDRGFATHTFKLKPLVPYGTVAGRTYDIYSGKPLEAELSFTGTQIEPVESNPVTGFFRADNVPAGLVSVVAQKEGFFTEERVVEVEDGGVTKLNIGLASLDMKGVLKGKVVDRKTGEPLIATISFSKAQRPSIHTDSATGQFELELPVGSFEVKVESWGYLPQPSSFNINKGDTTTRIFEMVSKGMALTLKGVYFEFAKAKLRTESYIALMEAARIMKENPDIRVEIQGHTDAIGTDKANQKLSERRAYAVINFLVQYGGVDAKRLVAKGYGESKPIATNDTDEGRQLNRRVDFVILK